MTEPTSVPMVREMVTIMDEVIPLVAKMGSDRNYCVYVHTMCRYVIGCYSDYEDSTNLVLWSLLKA